MATNYHPQWKWAVLLAGSISVLGCGYFPNILPQKAEKLSATQIADRAGYILVEPVRRIRNYRIDGWSYINNQAITLDVGASDLYLVTLLRPCRALKTSNVIATTSNMGDLTRYDSIIANFDSAVRLHCPIDKLYRLEKKPAAS